MLLIPTSLLAATSFVTYRALAGGGLREQVLALVVALVAGVAVFLAVAALLRVKELRVLQDAFAHKLGKSKAE